MNIVLSFVLSLLLTTLVSFLLSLVSLYMIWGSFAICSHFNFLTMIYENIQQLLAVFGEGSSFQGIWTIALVLAIAGFLFEGLNFYRYQILIEK